MGGKMRQPPSKPSHPLFSCRASEASPGPGDSFHERRRRARELLVTGVDDEQIREIFREESIRRGKGRTGHVRVVR